MLFGTMPQTVKPAVETKNSLNSLLDELLKSLIAKQLEVARDNNYFGVSYDIPSETDMDEVARNAIDNYDFSDHIKSVLEDHDFGDMFSDLIEDVKSDIRSELDDQIREEVESLLSSASIQI